MTKLILSVDVGLKNLAFALSVVDIKNGLFILDSFTCDTGLSMRGGPAHAFAPSIVIAAFGKRMLDGVKNAFYCHKLDNPLLIMVVEQQLANNSKLYAVELAVMAEFLHIAGELQKDASLYLPGSLPMPLLLPLPLSPSLPPAPSLPIKMVTVSPAALTNGLHCYDLRGINIIIPTPSSKSGKTKKDRQRRIDDLRPYLDDRCKIPENDHVADCCWMAIFVGVQTKHVLKTLCTYEDVLDYKLF